MRIHHKSSVLCVAGVLLAGSAVYGQQPGSQAKRDFTVADDIGLVTFGQTSSGINPISFSPDGKLVSVLVERGLLQENRIEDTLRIYETEALKRHVDEDTPLRPPDPMMVIRKDTFREGFVISGVRWLKDSRGVAYLVRNESARNQLWLADFQTKKETLLTPADQDVTGFDIHDSSHFAYTVRRILPVPDPFRFDGPPSTVLTGRTLDPLLEIPDDKAPGAVMGDRSELWAVRGGKPFQVVNGATGKGIVVYWPGQDAMSLSPDGDSVATTQPVESVPEEWLTKYPMSAGKEKSLRPATGPQDLTSPFYGVVRVEEYVTVNLQTGTVSVLTGAPTAFPFGWGGWRRIAWSGGGRSLILPGTFLSSESGVPPCVALVTPAEKTAECIWRYSTELESVLAVQFTSGDGESVALDLGNSAGTTTMTFTRTGPGVWGRSKGGAQSIPAKSPVEISVKESLNDPPVLIAVDPSTRKSQVILDPNPQLKQIRLGEALVYRWKDQAGKQWTGGLYKPVNHVPGQRYPLVIQTHGFRPNQFNPSGIYPSGFAARALAAAGIAVLQAPNCPVSLSGAYDEALCHVREYQSAVDSLVADGLVDRERVGIIGFSRSCYYVMSALTSSTIPYKAATITDGVNQGYLQYLIGVDLLGNGFLHDKEASIGAAPFGAGLQTWLNRSPEFNMDKVSAALQVVGRQRFGMLTMWEPYAMLRVLNKPVDFLLLNTSQHVITNPQVRLASQGGTVDWFRFWLQGYEDPDPAKKEQYARWRAMRDAQTQSARTGASEPAREKPAK